MPVLLVRHAHAHSRDRWQGEDLDRSLSERGRLQSRRLAEVLEGYAPSAIYSSPYVRCVDTVEPLAERMGLRVELTDLLAEGSGEAATALLGSVPTPVVLCSHGDVIPEVLARLAARDRLDLGHRPRCEKASVWVLSRRGGQYVGASYLRPPG